VSGYRLWDRSSPVVWAPSTSFWKASIGLAGIATPLNARMSFISAESAARKGSELSETSLEQFRQARDQYLTAVKEAAAFVKEHGVTGTAKYATDRVLAAVEDATKIPLHLQTTAQLVIDKVAEAWSSLAALPAGMLYSFSCKVP
jgi:hypothetical protein